MRILGEVSGIKEDNVQCLVCCLGKNIEVPEVGRLRRSWSQHFEAIEVSGNGKVLDRNGAVMISGRKDQGPCGVGVAGEGMASENRYNGTDDSHNCLDGNSLSRTRRLMVLGPANDERENGRSTGPFMPPPCAPKFHGPSQGDA